MRSRGQESDMTRKLRLLNRNMPLALILIPQLLCGNQQTSVDPSQEVSQLAVVLSLQKRNFSLGEAISVQVQLYNSGKNSILISNSVSLGGGVANLDLTLRDSSDKVSPRTDMTNDHFPAQDRPNAASNFLRYWMLLKPGNFLTTTVTIDQLIFAFLSKPGRYKLSGEYYSNGLAYPPTYRSLGLSDEDVRSLPYPCWTGKIQVNEVYLRIVPGKGGAGIK
jgi:hypothetical protein